MSLPLLRPSVFVSYLFVRQVGVCFGQCRSCVRLWEPVRATGEWMCVGFLPLSCAVPVSGYSYLFVREVCVGEGLAPACVL